MVEEFRIGGHGAGLCSCVDRFRFLLLSPSLLLARTLLLLGRKIGRLIVLVVVHHRHDTGGTLVESIGESVHWPRSEAISTRSEAICIEVSGSC